ncbi:unnamed protein product, partial [Prorocentrum cordatum]
GAMSMGAKTTTGGEAGRKGLETTAQIQIWRDTIGKELSTAAEWENSWGFLSGPKGQEAKVATEAAGSKPATALASAGRAVVASSSSSEIPVDRHRQGFENKQKQLAALREQVPAQRYKGPQTTAMKIGRQEPAAVGPHSWHSESAGSCLPGAPWGWGEAGGSRSTSSRASTALRGRTPTCGGSEAPGRARARVPRSDGPSSAYTRAGGCGTHGANLLARRAPAPPAEESSRGFCLCLPPLWCPHGSSSSPPRPPRA